MKGFNSTLWPADNPNSLCLYGTVSQEPQREVSRVFTCPPIV